MIRQLLQGGLLFLAFSGVAGAVEGGSGHYLMGSRDLSAGIVPPPGLYQSNDFVYLTADTPSALAIGGIAVTNPELEMFMYKPSITYAPQATVFGNRVALSVQLPIVTVNMDFTGVLGGAIAGSLSDKQSGLGDLTIVPMIGSDHGNFHFNFAGTMYLPTGEYSTAAINVPNRRVDVLSIGKNYFAFDPTLGVTYLDRATGFEATGALGVTFSAKNKATDYQTAPELHYEGAVAMHLANGLSVGMTGYFYQQLGEDSGSGATSFKAVSGSRSLKARTVGAGPLISWSG